MFGMKTRMHFLKALFFSLICFGGSALAAPSSQAGPTSAPLSPDDVMFLENAAEANDCLVGASQLVVQRSPNTQTKSFARSLINEHKQMAQRIKQLAAEKKVGISALISEDNRAALESLKSAKGEDIDRVYLTKFGIDTQSKEVELFQNAAKDASNPEIKTFAEQQLPTLRKQLDNARKLATSGSG
jgi:putative membrane protein